MIAEQTFHVATICRWIAKCAEEQGRLAELDLDELPIFVMDSLDRGCKFLEVKDRGFIALTFTKAPWTTVTCTPFALVSDGTPEVLLALLNAAENHGKDGGATVFRIEASTPKLLQFYQKRYVCKTESVGTLLSDLSRRK